MRQSDFMDELPMHRLDFTRGGSTLVVSFDNAGDPHRKPQDRRPWGHKFFVGEGHSVLGVIAHSSDWFRCPVLHDALCRLRDEGFFAQFETVAMTGSSMGGYAATAFASLSPGCHVISYNPQSTLHRDLVPWDQKHPNGMKSDWNGRFADGAAEIHHAGRAYIFYDPFHWEDTKHVARYQGDNIIKLRAPFMGHGLPETFHKMGLLKTMMREAIAGTLDGPTYYPLIRSRKDALEYYKHIIIVSARKDKVGLGLAVARKGQKKFDDNFFLIQEALFTAYLGELPKAIDIIRQNNRRQRQKRRKAKMVNRAE